MQEIYIRYVGVDELCMFNTLLKDNVLRIIRVIRIIRNTRIKQLRPGNYSVGQNIILPNSCLPNCTVHSAEIYNLGYYLLPGETNIKSWRCERANGDFKNMLYARLRDVKKELKQWVGELPYVQYSKNNAYHTVVSAPPHIVCTLGGHPLT